MPLLHTSNWIKIDSVDQCTKVSAVVHGIVMGIEMPFNLPNSDGCQNSGITCPIQKGANLAYSTTLPVLKVYPKVCSLNVLTVEREFLKSIFKFKGKSRCKMGTGRWK